MVRSCVAASALLPVLAAGLASPAAAAEPPALPSALPPITLVVPFASRGPTDLVARALAAAITGQTGQPVQVENRPGAGGTAGTVSVVGSPQDGRTLLLHHVGMATAPTLYRALPYDPRRDLEPIGRVVDVPMTLVARPGLPARGLADVLRLIRRGAPGLIVAYAGLGAASHLCGLLLTQALGVDLIQVPYTGTGPALADLQAGRADLMCDQTTNTAQPIREGRVQGLAVAGGDRLPGLRALPTTGEAGLPGLALSVWHGLYAPRGVARERVAELARLLQAGLAAPAFIDAMQGADVVVATRAQASPAALRLQLDHEIARWAPILRKAGQYAD